MYAPDCYNQLGTCSNRPSLKIEGTEAMINFGDMIETILLMFSVQTMPAHLRKKKIEDYPNSPPGMPGVQTIFPYNDQSR